MISNNSSFSVLEKYVPGEALPQLLTLMRKYPLALKITKARKSKFGDYRFPDKHGRHRISINHNLNKYAFLVTLLHEFAHLEAFLQYGKKIKPHGEEWQRTFKEVANPFLVAQIFPTTLASAFVKSLNRGGASSCTDINFYKALQAYDENVADKTFVEDLPSGALFAVNTKMWFEKGPKARTRYKCKSLQNGREYMVHAMAETISYKLPSNE